MEGTDVLTGFCSEGWIPNLITGLTEPFVSCDIVQDELRLQDQSYHLFALIGERKQYGVTATCGCDVQKPHIGQSLNPFLGVGVSGYLLIDVRHPASWVPVDVDQDLHRVR